ncbi:MAG: DUF4869 domain-containing protein [Lachnospiraceae bacterium]|nr:DUF4869 domain-containing protein [Lachnospiraceae bacterium]
MLNVYLGDIDEVIYNTSAYFKFNYQEDWLSDPDVIQMIRDVDNSEVLGNGAIDSPVLGIIAPISLSGGVKTLILIDKVEDKIFNASNCGDNCSEWLLRLGEKKDITVNLRHIMHFDRDDFMIRILNTNETVTNMKEFVRIAGRYV